MPSPLALLSSPLVAKVKTHVGDDSRHIRNHPTQADINSRIPPLMVFGVPDHGDPGDGEEAVEDEPRRASACAVGECGNEDSVDGCYDVWWGALDMRRRD